MVVFVHRQAHHCAGATSNYLNCCHVSVRSDEKELQDQLRSAATTGRQPLAQAVQAQTHKLLQFYKHDKFRPFELNGSTVELISVCRVLSVIMYLPPPDGASGVWGFFP